MVKRPELLPLRTFVIGYCVPLAPPVAELPVNADSLSWVSPEVEPLQFGQRRPRLEMIRRARRPRGLAGLT